MDRLSRACKQLFGTRKESKGEAVMRNRVGVASDVLGPSKLDHQEPGVQHLPVEARLARAAEREEIAECLPAVLAEIVSSYTVPHDARSLRREIAEAAAPAADAKHVPGAPTWQECRAKLLAGLDAWIEDTSAANVRRILEALNDGVLPFRDDVLGVLARSWNPEWHVEAHLSALVSMSRENPAVLNHAVANRPAQVAQVALWQNDAVALERALNMIEPANPGAARLTYFVAKGLRHACANVAEPVGFRACVEVLCRRMRIDETMRRKLADEAPAVFADRNLDIYLNAIRGSALADKQKRALEKSTRAAQARPVRGP